WTYFEPTPGRGAPDTSQYTGVPEQQAAEGGNPNVATTEVPTTVPTASTPPRPTTTERPQQSTSTTAPHRAGRPVTSYPLARLRRARRAGCAGDAAGPGAVATGPRPPAAPPAPRPSPGRHRQGRRQPTPPGRLTRRLAPDPREGRSAVPLEAVAEALPGAAEGLGQAPVADALGHLLEARLPDLADIAPERERRGDHDAEA